jgi:hypothetical protein
LLLLSDGNFVTSIELELRRCEDEQREEMDESARGELQFLPAIDFKVVRELFMDLNRSLWPVATITSLPDVVGAP